MVINVPVLNIFKKKTTCLTDCGMATDVLVENDFLKKWENPGLWDRGVATGGLGQKPDRKKMTGLSDSGMASGGLRGRGAACPLGF